MMEAGAPAHTLATQACMFVSAGILIIISSVAAAAIGPGPYFTILAGVSFFVSGGGYVLTWMRKRAGDSNVKAAAAAAAPEP